MVNTFNAIYDEFIAKSSPQKNMIYFEDKTLNVASFDKRVNEIAKHLVSLGAKTGFGIGYTLPNCIDVIPLFMAIAKIGAYSVPIFAGIPHMGKISIFKNSKVRLIITNIEQAEGIKKSATMQDYDVKIAVIEKSDDFDSIYGENNSSIDLNDFILKNPPAELPLLIASSSGTTGIPKLVMMTQQNVGSEMIASMEMTSSDIQMISNVAFPLSTSVVLVICGLLFSGTEIVYSADMSPLKYLELIEKHTCNEICSPPAYYESLLLFKDKHNFDLSSVIKVSSGMDFCSKSLLTRLREMFPNLKYHCNGYGLVETCNTFMYVNIDLDTDQINHLATLSLAKNADNIIDVKDEKGNSVPYGEEGELYVKGPNVVRGYLNKVDDAMDVFEGGWFKTGDIARKETDSTITLLGRKKYFIKRGGKSISPIVVQNTINSIHGVQDSGVVGVPHPLFGEMIWAFVVKTQDEDISLKAIKHKCKEHLPYYMLPDQVTFIDAIPKNPGVGKVGFSKLKEIANEQLSTADFKS